jgi:hypothetical protein
VRGKSGDPAGCEERDGSGCAGEIREPEKFRVREKNPSLKKSADLFFRALDSFSERFLARPDAAFYFVLIRL